MTTDPRSALERLTRWRKGEPGYCYYTGTDAFYADVSTLLSMMEEPMSPKCHHAADLSDVCPRCAAHASLRRFRTTLEKAAREAYGTEDRP